SLQRRHQKLVEEAPAPFLTDEQVRQMTESSKAILKHVGYQGAGTCEFLLASDGTVAFLEVNTRLQVEHPVTEEVTGIDLVREQFRIAEGEELGYDDPVVEGHSFEFRINGEDPGRGFLPAPGKITTLNLPSGPGIRIDSGVRQGDVVSGAFDSMLAKLIVTGRTREEALERSRRALDEFEVAGLPTVLPFHRDVVRQPAFTGDDGFGVFTRWIETEYDNRLEPWTGEHDEIIEPGERRNVVVEVNDKRIEVSLPERLVISAGIEHGGVGRTMAGHAPRRRAAAGADVSESGNAVAAPMQATIVKFAVEEGQQVVKGDLVVVLEAMKMEQPMQAPRDGVVRGIQGAPGDTVGAGTVLLEIADE
ncbi:MAG: acetyl-/propionyl-CoA carboxylase subunit alpha, partial [Microbacteriaceae bacterium]|nr:acetyl-/propionyl-CoA carboxylase subunit alpha [Microbacteriaceae bacterium]